MPTVDQLVDELIAHVPRAVVSVAVLAVRLGIPREGVQELAGEAQRSSRAILWPEVDSVVMDAQEAEARGLALYCPTEAQVDPGDGVDARPERSRPSGTNMTGGSGGRTPSPM